MMVNINCIYFEKGGYCTNTKVNKSLFGYGARCCSEYGFLVKCNLRVGHKRPSPPKAPPTPKGDCNES